MLISQAFHKMTDISEMCLTQYYWITCMNKCMILFITSLQILGKRNQRSPSSLPEPAEW